MHAHLVFTTKYRRRVITRRVFDALRRSMRMTARAIGVEICAIESDGDHLHLVVCYPPARGLSEIVRRLKGASSRMVRKMRLPEVLRRLWGNAFWSPSYFVVSTGGAPLEIVKAYVENQGKLRAADPTHRHMVRKILPYPRTQVRELRANL